MRGQISLDIILTIAIGFIAVSSVVMISNEITAMQTQSSLRQQLNDIGNGLAQVISRSAILDDADSAIILFDIPKILVLGETKPQPCDIQIDKINDKIILSYEVINLETGDIETVSVEKGFVEPTGMNPLPDDIKCGETLTITR